MDLGCFFKVVLIEYYEVVVFNKLKVVLISYMKTYRF